MPRTLLAAAVAALTLVLAPTAFAAKGFSFGVASGDVSSSSAILWAKANKSGKYTLFVSPAKRSQDKRLRAFVLRATPANDNTVQRRVTGLKAATRYRYQFLGRRGARSNRGSFVTAPAPEQNATVEFAWTGDTDFSPGPGQTTPFWNSGQVFQRMLAERNDFNVHFGDTIYSDSEIPGALQPIALTVEQKWA
ncbi:MAG: PhoD-like phosphatase N-terminal domain-containing protein, partial [Actinomycetota bacterium]|nr:PhoD-like phosphatase N-terminal domain-containing protein [Actinomycetota bacterium]